jgi:hypothetical protein
MILGRLLLLLPFSIGVRDLGRLGVLGVGWDLGLIM